MERLPMVRPLPGHRLEGGTPGGAPAGGPVGRALRFVSCGPPIPGFEVRIVDDRGTEIEERAEGAVEFRGPSTTSGYFRNPTASRALFDGEWLRSGDRGYVAGGELYVTGRDKDLIVRAGRNLYPYDLEAAVGEIDGVRKGCVAVFAASDPAAGTERLVVVAETRERDAGRRHGIEEAIVRVAAAQLGSGPDDVVLAPPHSVLKTSSGKIRRVAVPRSVRERRAQARRRLGADAGRPARARRGPRHGAVVGEAGGARRLHGVCRGGRRGDVRAGLARGGDGARERARPLAPWAGALPGRVPGPRHPHPGERRIEPGERRAVRARREPRELSRRPAALRGDPGAGRLYREGRACRQRLPRAAPARARGRVRQPAGPRAQRRCQPRRLRAGLCVAARWASSPRVPCTGCRGCCRSGSARSPSRWRAAPASSLSPSPARARSCVAASGSRVPGRYRSASPHRSLRHRPLRRSCRIMGRRTNPAMNRRLRRATVRRMDRAVNPSREPAAEASHGPADEPGDELTAGLGRGPADVAGRGPATGPDHEWAAAPSRGPAEGWSDQPPGGSSWARAVKLRDAARAVILAQCGEPDLGARLDVLDALRRRKREEVE